MATPQRLFAGMLALILGTLSAKAQIYVWTGAGSSGNVTSGSNWLGLTPPPNDGTAYLFLQDRLHNRVIFPSSFSLDSMVVTGGETMFIDSPSPSTLTVNGGIFVGDDEFSGLWFTSNITLNFANHGALDVVGGQITVAGQITGSNGLSLVSTSSTRVGFFIFNNTGVGHTYSGGTTLGDFTHAVGVAFWNSQPFGTGAVTVNMTAAPGMQLVAHGTQTVANNFTYNGTGTMMLRSWDAPLTFSGTITLAGALTLSAQANPRFFPAANQAGSFPMPGGTGRNPIIFSGSIGETGGSRTLTIAGNGITILTGANTYAGGTNVSGTVIFGSNSAVPAVGTILSTGGGYVGFGSTTPGEFAAFLAAHVNTTTSNGGIGIDTLPGNSTVTFADAINLTGYNATLRLGTATSAILTGTITPQGSIYQFGNGGGVLTYAGNMAGAKTLNLSSSSGNFPLTLYLTGSNSYSSGTNVSNGFLIFDSTSALPSSGFLVAGGSSLLTGASYIGYTDVLGLAPSTFLSKFTAASTWGIIGFDTHQGNATTVIGNINLTGFNNGVYIGTTTSAIINGTITPTSVANANNTSNTFRFTASQNATLTVDSSFTGATGVSIGTPSTGPYSGGTVILNGVNSHTAGTIIYATANGANAGGITLGVGNSSALGTAPLFVQSQVGGNAALRATAGGITLANTISLVNTGGTGFGGPGLHFTGTNAFTLSGTIYGDETTALVLYNSAPLTVTLSGDNSGFFGMINAFNGTLNLEHNFAAGQGNLNFGETSTGTVIFGGAATAPVLYGINGDSGNLVLSSGTNLTVDASDSMSHSTEFGGVVSGAGSLLIVAPTATEVNQLYLYGNNTYSGGTVVQNNGSFALGHSNGAGTGSVTLNGATSSLVLNSGVVFTNPLVYNAGTLGGFGTFAPVGTTNFTFDTGKSVQGGFDLGVGTLTLNADVTFANGGTYVWSLQDVASGSGKSFLEISGNLLITASAGGFAIKINTFDATFERGLANLTLGTPYSLAILTTTGSITGFSAAAFTVDSTEFQGGTMSGTIFSLSQSGNTIFLNFTPVPEPSTYALLALGLGALCVPALRRRRR